MRISFCLIMSFSAMVSLSPSCTLLLPDFAVRWMFVEAIKCCKSFSFDLERHWMFLSYKDWCLLKSFFFLFTEETLEQFVAWHTKKLASTMQQSSCVADVELLVGWSKSNTRSRCCCWAKVPSRLSSFTLFMRHAASSCLYWRCKEATWTSKAFGF